MVLLYKSRILKPHTESRIPGAGLYVAESGCVISGGPRCYLRCGTIKFNIIKVLPGSKKMMR